MEIIWRCLVKPPYGASPSSWPCHYSAHRLYGWADGLVAGRAVISGSQDVSSESVTCCWCNWQWARSSSQSVQPLHATSSASTHAAFQWSWKWSLRQRHAGRPDQTRPEPSFHFSNNALGGIDLQFCALACCPVIRIQLSANQTRSVWNNPWRRLGPVCLFKRWRFIWRGSTNSPTATERWSPTHAG